LSRKNRTYVLSDELNQGRVFCVQRPKKMNGRARDIVMDKRKYIREIRFGKDRKKMVGSHCCEYAEQDGLPRKRDAKTMANN